MNFGYILLGLEAVWALFWLACVFFFQLADGDPILLRNGFAITAFHAVNPAVIYAILRRSDPAWIHLFVFAFAFITDLNSLLETVLHVQGHVPAEYLYNMLLAVTCIAISLSSMAVSWFFYLKLASRGTEKKTAGYLRQYSAIKINGLV